MSVKLSGSLPADDRNGIARIAAALVDNPTAGHWIVALVACTDINTKVESGDVVPTARIRAIEGFEGHTADAKELKRLLRRAYERRTGRVELPLELEKAFDLLGDDQPGE
jgi:hypothetical protein